MKGKLIVIALGVALSASALWYAHLIAGRKARVDVATAVATAQRERNRDEIQRLATDTKEAEAKRAALQLELDQCKAKLSEMATKPAPAARIATPRDLMLNDPELQALWLTSRHARLSRNYGALYRQLGLSPAQIEKFQAASMKFEEQAMDLAGVAGKQDPADRAAVAALRKKAGQEFEAAVREALGSDGMRQLREYERLGSVRNMIGTVAGIAAIEGVALVPAQAEQLTTIVAMGTKHYPNGGPADVATADWAAVDTQARAVLSPEQFDIFRRWRVEYALDAAINRAKEAEGMPASRG